MSTPVVQLDIVLDPSNPDSTSKILVEVHPEWAPIGAQRFLDLIAANYYDEARIYRVIPGFIAQWGIPADPSEYEKWGENKITDDPVKVSNKKATMSFATSGPHARGSQVFINYDDSCAQLDSQGFAPFAKVIEGFDVAESFVKMPKGPNQAAAKQQGNRYFTEEYPQLSYIKRAALLALTPARRSRCRVHDVSISA